MNILRTKDGNGNWVPIPAIVGPKGETGSSGVHYGTEPPEDPSINLWIKPDGEITNPIPISSGGTGANTVASARNALGLGNTSGPLPVLNGGTGMDDTPSILVNLGSTSPAQVFTSSPRPGVTGTLPVTRGGTGATSAAKARQNLGIYADTIAVNISSFVILGNAMTTYILVPPTFYPSDRQAFPLFVICPMNRKVIANFSAYSVSSVTVTFINLSNEDVTAADGDFKMVWLVVQKNS